MSTDDEAEFQSLDARIEERRFCSKFLFARQAV